MGDELNNPETTHVEEMLADALDQAQSELAYMPVVTPRKVIDTLAVEIGLPAGLSPVYPPVRIIPIAVGRETQLKYRDSEPTPADAIRKIFQKSEVALDDTYDPKGNPAALLVSLAPSAKYDLVNHDSPGGLQDLSLQVNICGNPLAGGNWTQLKYPQVNATLAQDTSSPGIFQTETAMLRINSFGITRVIDIDQIRLGDTNWERNVLHIVSEERYQDAGSSDTIFEWLAQEEIVPPDLFKYFFGQNEKLELNGQRIRVDDEGICIAFLSIEKEKEAGNELIKTLDGLGIKHDSRQSSNREIKLRFPLSKLLEAFGHTG